MISSLCFCLGVIVVNAVYMVPNEGKEQEKRYVKGITYPEIPKWTRRKRMANLLDIIASGKALKNLMNSANEIISYRNLYKQFEKPGDYKQAIKDFESLNPVNVKELRLPGGVEGKMGRVVDRTVLIRSNSEFGKPMMSITHRDAKMDRIVYTD